jgi:hypothetical protein
MTQPSTTSQANTAETDDKWVEEVKNELLDIVHTMHRHCETAWDLIQKVHRRNGNRNILNVPASVGELISYKHGKFKLVDSELELSIEMKPEKLKEIAYTILADLNGRAR